MPAGTEPQRCNEYDSTDGATATVLKIHFDSDVGAKWFGHARFNSPTIAASSPVDSRDQFTGTSEIT